MAAVRSRARRGRRRRGADARGVQQGRPARRRGARALAGVVSGGDRRVGADGGRARRADRGDGVAAGARHGDRSARVRRRLRRRSRADRAALSRRADPPPRNLERQRGDRSRSCRAGRSSGFKACRCAHHEAAVPCGGRSSGWGSRSSLASACGPKKLGAATAGSRRDEVSRLHLSGGGSGARHAGGARAPPGRLAVAAGGGPQGSRAELRGRVEAVAGFLSGRSRPGLRRARAKRPRACGRALRSRDRRESALRAGAVGRGEALLALGQREMALKSLEAAVVADPSLGSLRNEDCGAAGARPAGRRRSRRGRRPSPAGWRMRGASTTGRLPPRPTVRSCTASWRTCSGARAISDAALQQAEKAAELDPTDARTHILIGDIQESRHDLKRAVAAYESAIALESEPGARKEDRRAARAARAGQHAGRVPGD